MNRRLPHIRIERNPDGRIVRFILVKEDGSEHELPPCVGVTMAAGGDDGFYGNVSIAWHGSAVQFEEVEAD